MDNITELKSAIDDFTASTTETLAQTAKGLEATRDELHNAKAHIDRIETRLNRPGTGGQGAKPSSRAVGRPSRSVS